MLSFVLRFSRSSSENESFSRNVFIISDAFSIWDIKRDLDENLEWRESHQPFKNQYGKSRKYLNSMF